MKQPLVKRTNVLARWHIDTFSPQNPAENRRYYIYEVLQKGTTFQSTTFLEQIPTTL